MGDYLDNQTAIIVMEPVEARPLTEITRSERLSLRRIRYLTRQVAAALAYAHGRGVVHRDVKPGTILVGPDDHVTVADFGVVRMFLEGSTMPLDLRAEALDETMCMGRYQAPEMSRDPYNSANQEVDGRTDLYALGTVLYEMVTGGPPFGGTGWSQVASRHATMASGPPRRINRDLPRDWEAVILKALEKDPARRYQTAAEMEAAIRRPQREGADRVDANDLPSYVSASSVVPDPTLTVENQVNAVVVRDVSCRVPVCLLLGVTLRMRASPSALQ